MRALHGVDGHFDLVPPHGEQAQIRDLGLTRRIALHPGLGMDFLHQNLQRAPANLAQVPIVVRKELLITAGAVDMNASPTQVAVGLAEAAIANECGSRAHGRLQLFA
jgi:hypothetical protein